MRNYVAAFLILSMTLSMSHGAMAAPKVSESIKHYSIKGKTADEIKANMKKKGPKGHWGYTEWYVKWSGSCKVDVSVKYIMPKLTSKAPADVKKSFDKMYAKLLKHEKNHGQSGILAGKEIEAKKCKNGDAILKKYNKRDKADDKKTKHGFTEGVKF
jgi:predicted secreted Zn-dependent protease